MKYFRINNHIYATDLPFVRETDDRMCVEVDKPTEFDAIHDDAFLSGIEFGYDLKEFGKIKKTVDAEAVDWADMEAVIAKSYSGFPKYKAAMVYDGVNPVLTKRLLEAFEPRDRDLNDKLPFNWNLAILMMTGKLYTLGFDLEQTQFIIDKRPIYQYITSLGIAKSEINYEIKKQFRRCNEHGYNGVRVNYV